MKSEIGFNLDTRLQHDSTLVADIGFTQLRLSNDARYPWLILVPKLNNLQEFTDLNFDQQVQILKVSNMVCEVMEDVFKPHKMNIAAIGNIVKQLHIHHVARFEYDDAWPLPVWGHGEASVYTATALQDRIIKIKAAIEKANQGDMHVNYYHQ
ncbi:MAG: HIT family protein [Glaciecola sp.]